MGADGLDRGAHSLAFMGTEIVHDDDVAGTQGRDQELLDIGGEGLAVDRTVDHAGRGYGVVAQGGKEGAGRPVSVWHRSDQTLAPWSAAVGSCHVRLHPGLVDEDEPIQGQVRLGLPPGRAGRGDVGPILLFGMERLFLRVRPSAARYR